VHVALDPALAGNINPDDTVFIFARAVDGPRMPLAVARHQARELPLTVMLDDSMSMSQALKLSGFNKVTVGARISKSGNAMPQSGDLLGLRTPVTTTNTARHDIIIDSIIP
jgi:cytochrome c-type biogenesis protein CcmH